jgi:hypothetical protein
MNYIPTLFKESELNKHKKDSLKEARTTAMLKQYEKENIELRNHVFSLQGEVYGARLAAKYLDKELAGRCVMLCYLEHCLIIQWCNM